MNIKGDFEIEYFNTDASSEQHIQFDAHTQLDELEMVQSAGIKPRKDQSLKIYVALLAAFLISAAVLFYPAFSSWYNRTVQQEEIHSYQSNISEKKEDMTPYIESAREYNKKVMTNSTILTDPYDYETINRENSEYFVQLSVDEVMGFIEIPAIDVNLPIYHGTSSETLLKGVGHLYGTSLPVGGIGTHSVLTSHTGVPGKMLFTDLIKLAIGDVFFVNVLGEKYTYQVDDISVILPTEIDKLALYPNFDYVTLLTCTPYGVNDHRLLVRGVRIFPEEMTEVEREEIKVAINIKKELTFVDKLQIGCGVIALMFFVVMLVMFLSLLRERRRQNGR